MSSRTYRCRRCASKPCPTRKSSNFWNSIAPITTPRSGTTWPVRHNWTCCARPISLKPLVAQTTHGEIPEGHAALFGGFARQALQREIEADHPLFQPARCSASATASDSASLGTGKHPTNCPGKGLLFDKLSHLAFEMQARRQPGEASRASLTRCLDLLAHACGDDVLKAGEALGVLEEDLGRDEVLYIHQLLQNTLPPAGWPPTPNPIGFQVEWRRPGLAQPSGHPRRPGRRRPHAALARHRLGETAVLAAAMAPDPDAFVTDLMAANLALTGRAASQPDVAVSESTKDSSAKP